MVEQVYTIHATYIIIDVVFVLALLKKNTEQLRYVTSSQSTGVLTVNTLMVRFTDN